jgi:hypothetical protein
MNSIARGQKKFLKMLSKNLLWTSKRKGNKLTKWILAHEAEFPVDYRSVLPNEVVYDLDGLWVENLAWGNLLLEFFKKERIPNNLEYTSGKGIHISIFVRIEEIYRTIIEENKITSLEIRTYLWNKWLDEIGIKNTIRGKGKIFDDSSIKFSLMARKGRIISLPGAKRGSNYATALNEIPKTKPIVFSEDIVFPKKIGFYYLSQEDVKELVKRKMRKKKELPAIIKEIKETSLDFPCVKSILSGCKEGTRAEGEKILSIILRSANIPYNEAKKYIDQYLENLSGSEYYSTWFYWTYSKINWEPYWPKKMIMDIEKCTRCGECEDRKTERKGTDEVIQTV